jgi:hypothetical protein
MDEEIFSGQLAHSLAGALQRGQGALTNVPELLATILKEERWREFRTEDGRRVSFDSFEEFLTANLPYGMETSTGDARLLCAKSPEALALLDEALKGGRS